MSDECFAFWMQHEKSWDNNTHIGFFPKKSANLQQKRINTLYYSIIQVLQICCRLWVFVADYWLF